MEKRRRSCEERKLPARGEWTTPFFRMSPSCTGVIEIEEAPMSMTRAMDLPAEKLSKGLVI